MDEQDLPPPVPGRIQGRVLTQQEADARFHIQRPTTPANQQIKAAVEAALRNCKIRSDTLDITGDLLNGIVINAKTVQLDLCQGGVTVPITLLTP